MLDILLFAMSLRPAIWSTVGVLALITAGIFVVTFPANFPDRMLAIDEKVRGFFDEITLPIKTFKLSLQEPDTEVFMPVYAKKVSGVANTWQAPRDGVRTHDGQDIFATRGTPIFSGTTGYVRRVGINELGGNHVMITGKGGRRYYYAHLDRFADGIRVGQWVTADTVLGFVGNTGNAITTPPHLHFGIYSGRDALNPLPLLVDRW